MGMMYFFVFAYPIAIILLIIVAFILINRWVMKSIEAKKVQNEILVELVKALSLKKEL